MSQKKLLIIIIILLLIGGLLAGYFYLKSKNDTGSVFSGGVFPSGGAGGVATNQNQNTSSPTDTPINNGNNVPSQLHQITSEPVAGSVVTQSGSTTMVRYIERATGHIYEARVDMGQPVRLSNTTIPKIYEALWLPDGSGTLLRYLSDSGMIKTYYAKLKASTGTTSESAYSLEGNFLPDNITSISVASNGARVFYLGAGGVGATGSTANPDGSKKVQVFTSPITHWQSMWGGNDTVLLTTNAASTIPGVTFLLSNAGGTRVPSKEKIVSNIYGLTASISPDKEGVLYSEKTGNSLSLRYLPLKDRGLVVKTLPLYTLPEKCLWSKKEKGVLFCAVPQSLFGIDLLDSWYQGAISFSDSFWKVTIATGETKIIRGASNLDAISLGLSTDEQYLIFTNKKDYSLWSLKIKQ